MTTTTSEFRVMTSGAFIADGLVLPVPGIAYITPLPPELQKVSTFAVGIAASCPNRSVARTAIEFLASTQAADAIRNSGLQIGLQPRPDQLPLIGPGAPPSA